MRMHAYLPDDINALKAMIVAGNAPAREREAELAARDAALRAELQSREAAIAQMASTLNERGDEIEHLKILIA